MTTAPKPDDVVEGPDPMFVLDLRQDIVKAVLYVCKCGYTTIRFDSNEGLNDMEQHLLLAHPAWRNPEITCQAREMSDDRWCVRPKGHEGDHWTPSFNGGFGWRQR